MWYPMTVAPVALQPSKETNFTAYTLHVEKPEGMTVLSQGIPTEEGDYISFRNLQNLTGLSLCIGDYRKRSFTTDSLTVEFYTYPGNDFYMESLDRWMEKIAGDPNTEEYMNDLKSLCRETVESEMPNPYPFKLLKIAEVPPAFLNGFPFRENIQPEMVFFSERMSAERIAWQNDGIFRLLRMFSAVFAPIPFTVQRSVKIFSSRFVANPYRLISSSRTISTVCRIASAPGCGSLS